MHAGVHLWRTRLREGQKRIFFLSLHFIMITTSRKVSIHQKRHWKMKILVYLINILTVTRAVLYENQTIQSTRYFNIVAVLDDVDELSRHHEDLFIDCSSCWSLLSPVTSMRLLGIDSSALLASSTAKRVNLTSTLAPHGALSPAASSTIVPFEQYWCKYNNALAQYGVNASDKDYCLSLERSDYSTWAAANHSSITRNVGGGLTFVQPAFWDLPLTQPCCGTYCRIDADAVEIYPWPTPKPYSNISSTIARDTFNK